MNKQQLFENIKRKKSFLCVGLDTDIKKIRSSPSIKPSSTQRLTFALPTNRTSLSMRAWA